MRWKWALSGFMAMTCGMNLMVLLRDNAGAMQGMAFGVVAVTWLFGLCYLAAPSK